MRLHIERQVHVRVVRVDSQLTRKQKCDVVCMVNVCWLENAYIITIRAGAGGNTVYVRRRVISGLVA